MATEISQIWKRGIPSLLASELTFITDTSDPSYDDRIEDAIPIADVMDVAANGIGEPVVIRQGAGTDAVIVDGMQRTKRALVVDHCAGVRLYSGTIQSVKEAIEAITAAGLDKRIMQLAPSGVKVPVKVDRGTEAFGRKIALNEHRSGGSGDSIARKASKARKMEAHGAEHEDIATSFGVGVGTVKRWLSLPVDGLAKAPKIGAAKKPGGRVVKKFETTFGGLLSVRELQIIRALTGRISMEELEAHFVSDFAMNETEARVEAVVEESAPSRDSIDA